ncbi:hypothetical protein CF327_g4742 [Tilletia walkeri]|nr:hypothetical protein CF327_g4742 [Tilletia walkeri]
MDDSRTSSTQSQDSEDIAQEATEEQVQAAIDRVTSQETTEEQARATIEYLTEELDTAEKKRREDSSEIWRLVVKVRGLNGNIRSSLDYNKALLQERSTLRDEVAKLHEGKVASEKELKRIKTAHDAEKKEGRSMRLRLAALEEEHKRLEREQREAREAKVSLSNIDRLPLSQVKQQIENAFDTNAALQTHVALLERQVQTLEKTVSEDERTKQVLIHRQSEANFRAVAFAGICRRATEEDPLPQDNPDDPPPPLSSRSPLSIRQVQRQSSPVSTMPYYCDSTDIGSGADSFEGEPLAAGEPVSQSKIEATSNKGGRLQEQLPLDSPTTKRVRTGRWAMTQGSF